MKKLFLLLISLCLTSGCKEQKTITSTKNEEPEIVYEYEMVKEKHIVWNELLTIPLGEYFAYIYSDGCVHCREIKQQIIKHALSQENFFFVEYNKSIPIIDNVEDTIGSNDLDEIGILGTPTLLMIKEGFLIENIAGSNAILEVI